MTANFTVLDRKRARYNLLELIQQRSYRRNATMPDKDLRKQALKGGKTVSRKSEARAAQSTQSTPPASRSASARVRVPRRALSQEIGRWRRGGQVEKKYREEHTRSRKSARRVSEQCSREKTSGTRVRDWRDDYATYEMNRTDPRDKRRERRRNRPQLDRGLRSHHHLHLRHSRNPHRSESHEQCDTSF